MHNAALSKLGVNTRYVALEVPVDEVHQALDYLNSLGYIGVNVTVPNKIAAMQWCKTLCPTAEAAGNVNSITLKSKTGQNFDVGGFHYLLDYEKVAAGTPALVIGSGATANSTCLALAQRGHITRLWARNPSPVKELARKLEIEIIYEPRLDGVKLIVDATSAGLKGEVLPLVWHTADPGALFVTALYGPLAKMSLAIPESKGLRTADGLAMLIGQGALSFADWHDCEPPFPIMREALK